MQKGDPVEVEMRDGWHSGWTFLQRTAATDRDYRVMVRREADGLVLTDTAAECVRRTDADRVQADLFGEVA